MKKYKLNDGGTIDAASAFEFLEQLHRGSLFDCEGTHDEYMHRFAERYEIATGIKIRSDNPDDFLLDLIAAGYAVPV
jgi:hypothetical protein